MKKMIYKGISTHNLKHIDVEIPEKKLVCIAGVSGSGKSSLAFGTIAAISIFNVRAAFVFAISGILRSHLVIIQNMLELCDATTLYHMTAKPECNFPLQAVYIKFAVHQQLKFL